MLTEEGRKKIQKKVQRSKKLVTNGIRIMETQIEAGGDVVEEWPLGNRAWHFASIRHFWRRGEIDGQLHEARVDGCSYGLKVEDGYLKKPWLLRGTTPLIWNLAKRCPGNHKHIPCEGGQRTRMSAFYPKAMAKRVWRLVRMIYEEATRCRPEAQTAWYLDEIDENQVMALHPEGDPASLALGYQPAEAPSKAWSPF